jgi:hypothetical protein
VREIVHLYHEARATVPPFDVIEFERQLHAVGSNDFNGYADRDGDDSARKNRLLWLKLFSSDKTRRIAANIAKLPAQLRKE